MGAAVDLTPIIVATIGGVFAVINAVAVHMIAAHFKDRQLRQVLENAVQNSLGSIQQAASGAVIAYDPKLIGIIPEKLAPGVQYVLNHASEAVERFGVTPSAVADKIVSRIGLKEIETNLAITASPASEIVPPLAPSAPGTTAADLNRAEIARHGG